MNKQPSVNNDFRESKPDVRVIKTRIRNELQRRDRLVKKYKRNARLFSLLFLILVCVGIFVVETYVQRDSSPVPTSIQNSVQFPVIYPKPSQQITIKESTFKYSKSLGQVSFIVNFAGSNITFAEQSSPDSFSADPTFYPTFIQKLNGYATFTALDGRVDLTLPSETHYQTAVMNAKGTLVFASSPNKLTENNWKLLFNTLENTQP